MGAASQAAYYLGIFALPAVLFLAAWIARRRANLAAVPVKNTVIAFVIGAIVVFMLGWGLSPAVKMSVALAIGAAADWIAVLYWKSRAADRDRKRIENRR